MILFLIGLSTFSIGLSHATSCHSLQQSQLASLNERMNQMISALYPSAFSKSKATAYPSSTPAPTSEYSSVSPYDPSCYQGYQQMSQPNVIYMSQPSSPTTVAFSPPAPGSPPTVTISTTRTPCYQYEGQEYSYGEPKYPPQYYEYSYPQYPPPYPAPPPQYTPPECPCQQQNEYPQQPQVPQQAPCPHRPYPTQNPPAQPEYNQGGCPPAPPCSPPPPYTPGPYPQPPNYPPSAYPPPPSVAPPYPSPPYPSYPPTPYPPPPYPSYGPPAYPQAPQYPPVPTYTNPRDAMLQPPQYQ